MAWPGVRHAVEDEQRRLLELDADLRGPLLETLAGAQIERNAGPAPVLDFQPKRGISLRRRFRVDPLFVAVARHAPAFHHSRPILAAHGVEDWNRRNGAPHFHLLAPDGLGVEAGGRLHGDKT